MTELKKGDIIFMRRKSQAIERSPVHMYTALDYSKYAVCKCIEEKHPISNLQLQKILYFIQKDFLLKGLVAFPDYFEAWRFGPVIPNVYYYFCSFGAMPITIKESNFDVPYVNLKAVNDIIVEKRELNPWDVVEETHKKGGAWDLTYRNGAGNHHIIPVNLIRTAG